uniref:Tudor domain-containing protein n=1 Tax=Ascaris lumbricoides TaxID=6252 RepID=A0A9J2NR70_ASCLU
MSEAMSATATTPFSYDLYETVSRIAAEPRSFARRRMFKLSTSSNGGVFKPYAVTFPQQVRALVIEKMTYGTYSMSDTEALRALTELLTFPEKKDLINLNSLSKHPTYPKLPCIVTAAGDARISLLPYHSGVVRGILDDFLREENMCKVVLVDYGQTILCSASIVFYFTSQSSEAREAPVALFNCRISELTPRGTNGYNTVELSAGMTYEICLLRKLNNKLLAGIAIEPFSWSPVMDDVNLKGEEQQLEALHGNIDTFIKNPEGGETTIAIARKKVEEEEEALHRERIAFEQECMEREKELALAAMQMQLLDFSSRLNTVYAASQHVSFDAVVQERAASGLSWTPFSPHQLQAMSLAKNGFQNNGQRMLLPLDCRESVGIRSRRQSSLSDAASRSILFSGESLLPATGPEVSVTLVQEISKRRCSRTKSLGESGSNLTEAGSCSNRQLANADYSRYRSARTHAPVGLLESDIELMSYIQLLPNKSKHKPPPARSSEFIVVDEL